VQRLVRDLNALLRTTPALHDLDFTSDGFQWLDCDNSNDSVLAFLRKSRDGGMVMAACNFTPVPRDYRVGVPRAGRWRELLNSDAKDYGGSGVGNFGGVQTEHVHSHGHTQSVNLRMPPLAVVVFTPD
jgi:1,4-alpha-glucan branching enzyme